MGRPLLELVCVTMTEFHENMRTLDDINIYIYIYICIIVIISGVALFVFLTYVH